MNGSTLPAFIWIIYYLIIVLTIIKGYFNMKKFPLFGFLDIIISILLPILGFLNSVKRGEGVNELEYLISSLILLEPWAILSAVGLAYIVVSWIKFKLQKPLINN